MVVVLRFSGVQTFPCRSITRTQDPVLRFGKGAGRARVRGWFDARRGIVVESPTSIKYLKRKNL